MGLFSFLRSSKQQTPDLFERELEQLELKIQDHQQRLQLISERQRDTTASITLYSCLCWSIYSTLWYFGWSPSFPRRNKQHHAAQFAVLSNPKFTQSLQVLPIILIPIGSAFSIYLHVQKKES
jgi:predicted GIY-YIG superfamily endonuclease